MIQVYGDGYGPIGDSLNYRLITSERSGNPAAISANAPFHFQLDPDEFVLRKYIELTLPHQVMIAGLKIYTPKSLAMKRFNFKYSNQEILFPGEYQEFQNDPQNSMVVQKMVLFLSYFILDGFPFFLKTYNIYYGDVAVQPNEMERTFIFPQPIVTRKFKMEVIEGAATVAFKMDLIGKNGEQKYDNDPNLEPLSYTDCEIQEKVQSMPKGNFNNDNFYSFVEHGIG